MFQTVWPLIHHLKCCLMYEFKYGFDNNDIIYMCIYPSTAPSTLILLIHISLKANILH